MNAIVLLFMTGIVLLVFEVVVPGAVLGILGTLAMLGGCVLAFHLFGSGGGTLACAAAMGLLGVTLYLELVLLPKSRLGKKFMLRRAVEQRSQPAPANAAEVVGKLAEAITTLAPSGYVLVDQRRYEARSQSGLIAKGATVRVTGIDNFQLTVTIT